LASRRLLGFGVGFGLLGLGFFFGVELGQALLLFTQVRFLAGDQLGLAARLFLAARHFGGVDDGRGGRRGGAGAGAATVRRAARRCAS
jgi:hypothetical protein